jgi:hypothetical protein
MAVRYLNGIKNVKPVEDIEKKKSQSWFIYDIIFSLQSLVRENSLDNSKNSLFPWLTKKSLEQGKNSLIWHHWHRKYVCRSLFCLNLKRKTILLVDLKSHAKKLLTAFRRITKFLELWVSSPHTFLKSCTTKLNNLYKTVQEFCGYA